ncbi:proteinase-activated receptor 4 [Tachyglossus aculeatus]|uniref:proteinase-activated receptor 4 n=1 Tax=Tachyglossus aculeatus TaxID=9261 RepID=UPI0018F3766F|nr:proteinase-activated receptor 4 [Tachyglossus aculeatus]
MGTSWARHLLYQVILWTCLMETCFLEDYDYDEKDQSANETADGTQGLLCPRSFPGVEVGPNMLCIRNGSKDNLLGKVTTNLISSVYTAIFLVGLPANGLALWLLATKIQRLASTIFLMNLAAADLLLVLVLPFKISYYFLGHNWLFGEGMCRLTTAFFYGNMYCSVLLLTCISLDRYLAIVHPFFSRSFRSPNFATCVCVAVWLLAVAFTLPLTLRQQSYQLHSTDLILCHDVLPQEELASYYLPVFGCLIVLGFFLPLLVILFSYCSVIWVLAANGEKYSHAIKLTVLVLASILLFFTPSNALLLLHYSYTKFEDLYIWYMLSLAFSTFNSCVDPFIYYYVSEEFRGKVRRHIFLQDKSTVTLLKASKETTPGTRTQSVSLV